MSSSGHLRGIRASQTASCSPVAMRLVAGLGDWFPSTVAFISALGGVRGDFKGRIPPEASRGGILVEHLACSDLLSGTSLVCCCNFTFAFACLQLLAALAAAALPFSSHLLLLFFK